MSMVEATECATPLTSMEPLALLSDLREFVESRCSWALSLKLLFLIHTGLQQINCGHTALGEHPIDRGSSGL